MLQAELAEIAWSANLGRTAFGLSVSRRSRRGGVNGGAMKRRGRSGAGFTLLELLVAMTVLGILTALLASGLSFGTRVWERKQGQLDQRAELQSVQDVIRRTVLQSLPLSAPSTDGTGAVAFVGTNSSIDFLGPPAAQSTVGGIYQYRLLTRTGTRGPRLVLTWRLRNPDST